MKKTIKKNIPDSKIPRKKTASKKTVTALTREKVKAKDILQCREFSSYTLSIFFIEIIEAYKARQAQLSAGEKAKSVLDSIDNLKKLGVPVPHSSIESFRSTTHKNINQPTTKKRIWSLDTKNHEVEMFNDVSASDLMSDKALKKVLIPHWAKTFKIIRKIFREGIGNYGFSEEMTQFFFDLNTKNPKLLKILGYKGGDISLKNLERLGEKTK